MGMRRDGLFQRRDTVKQLVIKTEELQMGRLEILQSNHGNNHYGDKGIDQTHPGCCPVSRLFKWHN